MGIYAQVYRECLSNLDYGIPLWEPRPRPREVQIGDVGIIDGYGFWMHLLTPEFAGEMRCVDLPDVIEAKEDPFTVRLYKRDQSSMRTGILWGFGGTAENTQARCKGASLELKTNAHGRRVMEYTDLIDKVRPQIREWVRLGQRRDPRITESDIVLVVGHIKANKWRLTAYPYVDPPAQGTTGIEESSITINSPLHTEESIRTSADYISEGSVRSKTFDEAEDPKEAPKDCLFITNLHVRFREQEPGMVKSFIQGFLSPWTGSAQAGASSGSSAGNTGTGAFNSTHTLPVHRILKHLLEVTDAEVAMAPDTYIHPVTKKLLPYSHLTDEQIRKIFTPTITPGGVATVDFDQIDCDFLSRITRL